MSEEVIIFLIMFTIVVLVALVWAYCLQLHEPDGDDQGWPTGEEGEEDE